MTQPENSRRGDPCRIAIRLRSSSGTGCCCCISQHGSHIGESVAETNAVTSRPAAPNASLLAVVFQHLVAGSADLGAIVLQTGQNGEITLVENDNRVRARRYLRIVFLHSGNKNCSPRNARRHRHGSFGLQNAANRRRRRLEREAPVNAAKFTTPRPLCGSALAELH
jgi:hypothetical protein